MGIWEWELGSGEWGFGSGEWGVGSGEWGVGSGEWGVGSGEWGVGSGEWGVGIGEWGIGSGSLFQALGQRGRSKKRAGEERDQLRAGSGSEKETAGEPVSIVLKTSFRPLGKRNHFLCQNVKCQNLRMFSIELLARVSRSHADLHSVLCSSAIVYVCCVSENLFECRSLYLGVQKINYRQMIRPIWRIETMIL